MNKVTFSFDYEPKTEQWTAKCVDMPSAVASAATLTEAINAAAISALYAKDSLLRFGTCDRRDCGRQYLIKGKHSRKFCSFNCAHLVSVRKQRAKTAKRTYVVAGEPGQEQFIPATRRNLLSLKTATVTYNIDARGADGGVEKRIIAAIEESRKRAEN